jgi:hypothetical protein
MADRRCQHAGCQQHIDEQIVELKEETRKCAGARPLRQAVGSMDAQPAGGIVIGETAWLRTEPVKGSRAFKGMPRTIRART